MGVIIMKKFVFLLALAVPLSATALEVQQQGSISYLSGGIGSAERDVLKLQEPNFNLKLMFASKEGPFLSDAPVEILDSKGNSVLSATADGPFFYAKLPAGTYTVKTGNDPLVKTQKVTVKDTGLRSVNFFW